MTFTLEEAIWLLIRHEKSKEQTDRGNNNHFPATRQWINNMIVIIKEDPREQREITN
jgi:hypothetical protein